MADDEIRMSNEAKQRQKKNTKKATKSTEHGWGVGQPNEEEVEDPGLC